MPKKPVTWIGSLVILGAGAFCISGLSRYRSQITSSNARFELLTWAMFLAVAVALLAVYLLYYFNEKH